MLEAREMFQRLNRIPKPLADYRPGGPGPGPWACPNFSRPCPAEHPVPFLASPVFHRGQRLGNIFLADKDGGAEFTRTDEETLVMFASQAVLVIANARSYRDEQQARRDLETLVNTSPVGVYRVRRPDRGAGILQPRGHAHRGQPPGA